MFIVMALVDIFDVYEKFNKGFVDKKHLTIRINALKLGTMKTPLARALAKGVFMVPSLRALMRIVRCFLSTKPLLNFS